MDIQLYKINYQTDDKAFYSRPHSHQHVEIFYFLKGNATHYIDFEAYPITDNSFFLVSFNQVHHIEAPAFSHNVGYVISLKQDFFDLLEPDFQKLFGAFSKNPAYYLNKSLEIFFASIFQEIENELSDHLPKTNYLILLFTKVLLTYLHRQKLSETKNASINHYEQLFQNFLNLLEIHIRIDHSVQAYANRLLISTKQLNRVCKRMKQQTASSIIYQRLNLEAKRLLVYTQEPVKEITYTLGFQDAAHFSNFFKKRNAQSPESFRKQMSRIFK